MHRASHAIAALALAGAVPAQDSRAVAVELPQLPQSRYFRIDPAPGTPTPKAGLGLLVVLPGGAGSAEFLPWVEHGILPQLPADFVGAMLTAPQWKPDQAVVWPTARSKVAGMQYDTESYVRAVVASVQKAQAIDPQRTLLLAWSSSGPAAYELLLGGTSPFRRAYVAMSVYRDPGRPQLANAKGLRLLLDQSPDDQVTGFQFAERAQQQLGAAGAVVRLLTYRGGHGWQDEPKARLREGLRWLLSQEPPPAAAPAPAAGDNLLQNGGFEHDTAGWQVLSNSGRLQVDVDRAVVRTGNGALHLRKTGKLPLDLVRQEVRKLGGARQLLVSCQVRSRGCDNAWVKFLLYDAQDRLLHQDVDLVHLTGDQDWQLVQKTFDAAKASYGVLQVVMVLGGEVWVDDARVAAVAPK